MDPRSESPSGIRRRRTRRTIRSTARRTSRWALALFCIAIGLAAGIYAGMNVPKHTASTAALFGGVPSDPQAVELALETLASGESWSEFDNCSGCRIVPVSTLRTAAGGYCREYDANAGASAAHGLACRQVDGNWRTEYLLGGAVLKSALTMGHVPSMAAVVGEAHALTAAEEALAIHKRWIKLD
jgi:hypothetical protein